MAATSRKLDWLLILTVLNVWIWGLSLFTLNLRWKNHPLPLPQTYEAFPYGELRVGIDPSYPPFAIDNNGDLAGFEVDLARAIADTIDVPLRLVPLGYDGLYDAIRADRVDVVISTLPVDPSRMAAVRYTDPYFNNGYVLVATDTPPDDDALQGREIAHEYGSEADTLVRTLSRRIGEIDAMPYELPTYALDAVRLGEAETAVVAAIDYHQYRNQYPQWDAAHRYLTDLHYAAAVRIDRVSTWRRIDHALDALRRSGELEAIRRRWL